MKINTKFKSTIMIMIILVALTLSGCVDATTPTNSVKGYEKENGVENVVLGKTFNFESKFTEANQERLITSNPPPRTERSLERENLAKRNLLLNDQNKIFYVYLISYGKVMAFHTAQGKISSVNSRLTQEEQIVADAKCLASNWEGSRTACYMDVGSPQLDGSYGTNGDAIFFFKTSGAYVEWAGEYQVSDYPLKMSTPPVLYSEVDLN